MHSKLPCATRSAARSPVSASWFRAPVTSGRRWPAGLVDAGALVAVADIDTNRAAGVAARIGATTVESEVAHAQLCDVFAPCASARVLDAQSISELRCTVVVGAANDVLADRAHATLLAERGITYVPDFLSNAGGVIQIHAERASWSRAQLATALAGIGSRTTELLKRPKMTTFCPWWWPK